MGRHYKQGKIAVNYLKIWDCLTGRKSTRKDNEIIKEWVDCYPGDALIGFTQPGFVNKLFPGL